MEAKHLVIQEWLKEVFADSAIPDYEVDSETIDTLYLMAQESKERERQVNIVIKELEQKALDYDTEANRIDSFLKWVGVSLKDLPSLTQRHIEVLAEAALTLQVMDSSPSSLSLGMSTFLRKEAALKTELYQQTQKVTQVETAIEKAKNDKDYFIRLSQELALEAETATQTGAQRKKEAIFLEQKSQQYKKVIANLETELTQNGFNRDIQHQALLQCYQEIQSLEKQLQPLKVQLEHFTDLPPDLELTRLKVEEARQELAKLESELSQNIDLIHVEK